MISQIELLELLSDSQNNHLFKPVTERIMTIGTSDISFGCSIASHVLSSSLLTSAHRIETKHDLWETPFTKPRLTRENPDLLPAELAELDSNGLISQGSFVRSTSVIASVIAIEKLAHHHMHLPRNNDMDWATDRSWRASSLWDGYRVESIALLRGRELGRRPPKGLAATIELILYAEHSLRIGDTLLIGGNPVIVSERTTTTVRDRSGNAADIVVSIELATKLGITPDRFLSIAVSKRTDRSDEVFDARNTGAYSLITQTPLRQRPGGGQLISSQNISWLVERGYQATIDELTSLKSDDILNRCNLRKLRDVTPGTTLNINERAACQSLHQLVVLLKASGLKVDLKTLDKHIGVGVSLATESEIISSSSGEVKKSETLHYKTLEEIEEGLFCPNIFGDPASTRRQRFGHIQLCVPVIPPILRHPTCSLLTEATGLSQSDIESLLDSPVDLLWDEGKLEIVEHWYKPKTKSQINLGTGPKALHRLREPRIVESLSESQRQIVPYLTTTVFPVIPPDWRPLVLLDNGNFATSDLNELYRQVITRNNRLRKLVELNAPSVILDEEIRNFQWRVDSILANQSIPEWHAILRDNGERLKDLRSELLGLLGAKGKHVDWCGKAKLIVTADGDERHALVPRDMFETLRLAIDLPVLLTMENGAGNFVACYPHPHDEKVVTIPFETYSVLTQEGASDTVCIHRPVTNAGKREAEQMLRDRATRQAKQATASDVSPGSWATSTSIEELTEKLLDAALRQEYTVFSHPSGLLVGGTGAINFEEDRTRLGSTTRRFQVPSSSVKEQVHSDITQKEILDVAMRYLQRVCYFDLVETDSVPLPEQGRIGGTPYLPTDLPWPTMDGIVLEFLGQFPLDPARDAGVLSNVPPTSMASVFHFESDFRIRTKVFIHSSHGLKQRELPYEKEYPQLAITIQPRIDSEMPAWKEMLEILNWELCNPDPKILQDFHDGIWTSFLSAVECVKFGGWPSWIQCTATQSPLFLQLASNDQWALFETFDGTVYIFSDENGSFFTITQFD